MERNRNHTEETGLTAKYERALQHSGAVPDASERTAVTRHSGDGSSSDGKGGAAFKRAMAAFTAGALLVGGLSFTADRLNIFSGGAAPATSVTAVTAGASSGAQDKLETAAVTLNPAGTTSIAAISAAASPAVVKIESKATSPQNGGLQTMGTGSGFLFDASGYILTNEHVVNGAEAVDVLVDGYDTPFRAVVTGTSYDLDLAVLKIEGEAPFTTLKLGSTDASSIGDWVVAIGNPYEFDHTVTAGLLSAKGRTISIDDEQGTRTYNDLIQTDAAINPGNSGGPLLNLRGEVIGINTAVDAEAEGIGFAISTATVDSVLERLKAGQSIPRTATPYLGVNVQNLTADMAAQLGLAAADGAIVAYVQPNTPAYRAGLRQYDVVTAVDGSAVADADALVARIKAAKVGDTLRMTVTRSGRTADIDVTVGDRASAQRELSPS